MFVLCSRPPEKRARRSREETAKKCTKKRDARTKLLFCQSKSTAFLTFLLSSPSSSSSLKLPSVIRIVLGSWTLYFALNFTAVRMNGVVKTDETDSVASMPVSTTEKPGHESAVIQPQGIGPAIHLNGSSVPVSEDQPVQVSPFKDNFVNHSIFALDSFVISLVLLIVSQTFC